MKTTVQIMKEPTVTLKEIMDDPSILDGKEAWWHPCNATGIETRGIPFRKVAITKDKKWIVSDIVIENSCELVIHTYPSPFSDRQIKKSLGWMMRVEGHPI